MLPSSPQRLLPHFYSGYDQTYVSPQIVKTDPPKIEKQYPLFLQITKTTYKQKKEE